VHRFQQEAGERFGAAAPFGQYDVVIEASGTEGGREPAR
jgi:hypothetical protein